MRIDIALFTYDDIFSDFDIRDYRQRQLSKDFLDELRIRMVKKSDSATTALVMMIEKSQRNEKYEKLIIKRLRGFFEERYTSYLRQRKKNIAQAAISGLAGVGLLLAAYVLSTFVGNLFRDFLLIPSWYLVWTGLEKMIGNGQEIAKKLTYYRALSVASIEFRDKTASA